MTIADESLDAAVLAVYQQWEKHYDVALSLRALERELKYLQVSRRDLKKSRIRLWKACLLQLVPLWAEDGLAGRGYVVR